MNNTNNLENLKDPRALRREKKKRPRMRKHSAGLRKFSKRAVLRIHKVSKTKK